MDLAFRLSGYVVEIHRTKGADGRTRALEPGAAVASGLVLARVRATDYQAVVDKAAVPATSRSPVPPRMRDSQREPA